MRNNHTTDILREYEKLLVFLYILKKTWVDTSTSRNHHTSNFYKVAINNLRLKRENTLYSQKI